MHPLLNLQRFSIVSPHVDRSLLWGASFWSGLFIAALFFSISGDAMSVKDPVECGKEGVPFARAIAVAGISSILGSGCMAMLAMLHTRNFVYCGGPEQVEN